MTDDFDARSLGVLDGSLKGFPPASVGLDAAGFLAAEPALAGFTTPLVTLDRSAVTDNVETMRRWCEHAGVGLAPHGKTTMNRALWQRQLDAGSWGITVATPWQLAIALDWSIPRVMLANALVQPEYLRAVARALDAGTAHIVVWADSVRAVQIMSRVLAAEQPGRPLHVLVELGSPGGRTGARDQATALEIAEAVVAAPELALAGVSGYEGALAHHGDDGSLEIVRDYLQSLAALHTTLLDDGRYDDRVETVIVTAGGSAYFDVVAEVLAGLRDLDGAKGRPVDVLLRSGAYITHDDGFYRGISPLGVHPRDIPGRDGFTRGISPLGVHPRDILGRDGFTRGISPLGVHPRDILGRDGFTRGISPLGVHPRDIPGRDGFTRGITPPARHEGTGDFRSAIHGWATIVSRPEPGLALIDGGKRDFPFDEGLPEVQGVRRAGSTVVEPLVGATATAMNDQHTFIALPPGSDLEVGDILRLGLSHPCTTFDKWRALIVIDDSRADEPHAVDAVTTTFG